FTTSYFAANVGLSILPFARGPGQDVNLARPGSSVAAPANYGGIPIQLTDGNHATIASFTLVYKTTLLNVSGVNVDPGMPAGSTCVRSPHVVAGGAATDVFTFNTNSTVNLGSGSPVTLGELTAAVPNVSGQTIYRDRQDLQITAVAVNGDKPGV